MTICAAIYISYLFRRFIFRLYYLPVFLASSVVFIYGLRRFDDISALFGHIWCHFCLLLRLERYLLARRFAMTITAGQWFLYMLAIARGVLFMASILQLEGRWRLAYTSMFLILGGISYFTPLRHFMLWATLAPYKRHHNTHFTYLHIRYFIISYLLTSRYFRFRFIMAYLIIRIIETAIIHTARRIRLSAGLRYFHIASNTPLPFFY